MAKRKSFLIRIDPEILGQLQKWADDDLRSLNGQIEFLLRKALRDTGRSKDSSRSNGAQTDSDKDSWQGY